jgi:type I restriction-modification system DNA methylase subunit
MSKYDTLNARTELEQVITHDLNGAFNKRGLTAEQQSRTVGHAPANVPDIILSNEALKITVECTKSKGAAQDREFNSIKDHLQQVKDEDPSKDCFCIFTSSYTSQRMLDSIREHNFVRKDESDLKIFPLCFDTLELLLRKLSDAVADLYTTSEFVQTFDKHAEFVDDQRIKKLLYRELFSTDTQLGKEIEKEEIERDQKMLESLIKDLDKLENYLRESGIATGERAIDTLIYLVFVKLYEEKRVKEGIGKNRLKGDNFIEYKNNLRRPIREGNQAIHELFNTIKSEAEFEQSGMFSRTDNFSETLTDEFIIRKVIPVFDNYAFLGTRLDALGAVYEVLALRANKDVKVGQFFTPENVVNFMVKLAELDIHDIVLDPACGTGRFLIWAMDDILKKVDESGERDKEELKINIRLHQLFGADIDNRIAKIAKMNMWIHGDGKTNIIRYNGLLLDNQSFNGHGTYDNSFDIVLTNPPLGDLNYQEGYTSNFRTRMEVLPLKNTTVDKLNQIRERLEQHRSEKQDLESQKLNLEGNEIINNFQALIETEQDRETRRQIRELKQSEVVRAYLKIVSEINQKDGTIENNEEQIAQLEALIRTNSCEYEVTGNRLKGGALFINAICHYLKSDRMPEALPEWRGGKMITIIDEGVLNTDDYRRTREVIKKNFYIKAVISLSRDTFIPVSNTSNKTSVLYAIKKQDPTAVQQEPIFYAHVEKVGMDTKKKVCSNHLEPIWEKYFEFRTKVIESYDGLHFNKRKFLAQRFEKGRIE